MIKLYKASSFKYTPFENFVQGDLSFLNKNNIEIVENVKNADIIISQNFKHLKPFFWRSFFGQKFLIWTLESRFDKHFKSPIKVFLGLLKCHVMNVYTKDVFVSNLTFHAGSINKKLDLVPNDFELKTKKVIALMSYYKGIKSESLIKDGNNIDLISLRTKIALFGNDLGFLDIYGKGWPIGVSKEDSREGDWVNRKKELMSNYNFNLCFENTATFNYTTEKIWDSIENYCLPVYYGKHTNVYELFPENSFVDYSNFKNPEELFKFIYEITNKEFVERMNKCIKVYNSISQKGDVFVKSEREKMLNNIVERIKHIHI